MVCEIGIFAFGEVTRDLRLTSKLVDLRSGYANPAPYSAVVRILYYAAKKKENRPSNDGLFSLAAE